MKKEFGTAERGSSTMQARLAEWAAYAACGWAFLFAALSFFWAAGGRTGLQPLEQAAASSGRVWIAINLSAGVLKALAGWFWVWACASMVVLAWSQMCFTSQGSSVTPRTGNGSSCTSCSGTPGGCWEESCSWRRLGSPASVTLRTPLSATPWTARLRSVQHPPKRRCNIC